MVPCPHCATLLRAGDVRCVHCGERLSSPPSPFRSTAAAALLGLAVACTGDGGKDDSGHTGTTDTTPQPLYGVTTTDYTDTDTDTDTDSDTDTDTDTDATGGTGATGGSGGGSGDTGGGSGKGGSGASGSGSTTIIQPLYGVTTTTY